MTPGEARGLATFLRSIREDWQTAPILAALDKLQSEKYSTQDITEVCTAIALDHSNQLPVMLSMKGGELILRKHQQKTKPRSTGQGKLPDQFKCDTCGKVESVCQSDATNLNGADHPFVPVTSRDNDRDQMHADGRIAAARKNALDRAMKGMWSLPADINKPSHPEPQIQEEEAS
jgi:hypothetical protein